MNIKLAKAEDSMPPLPNIKDDNQRIEVIEIVPYKDFTPIPKQDFAKTLNANSKKTNSILLKKGTVFDVVSLSNVSSSSRIGTSVSFKVSKIKTFRYVTIGYDTYFYGKVKKSHYPQFFGNGGLVAIEITGIKHKGKMYKAQGFIRKADNELVFFNNIKGSRTYLQTVRKKTSWGKKQFSKTYKAACELAKEPVTLILAPFSILTGTLLLASNIVLSPILATGAKGKNVYMKSGTRFKIKLKEDVVFSSI